MSNALAQAARAGFRPVGGNSTVRYIQLSSKEASVAHLYYNFQIKILLKVGSRWLSRADQCLLFTLNLNHPYIKYLKTSVKFIFNNIFCIIISQIA